MSFLQGSSKEYALGLVKFVPAVAYHFFLNNLATVGSLLAIPADVVPRALSHLKTQPSSTSATFLIAFRTPFIPFLASDFDHQYKIHAVPPQPSLPGVAAGYRERLLAKNFESFYLHSGRKFLRTISPYTLPRRPV